MVTEDIDSPMIVTIQMSPSMQPIAIRLSSVCLNSTVSFPAILLRRVSSDYCIIPLPLLIMLIDYGHNRVNFCFICPAKDRARSLQPVHEKSGVKVRQGAVQKATSTDGYRDGVIGATRFTKFAN